MHVCTCTPSYIYLWNCGCLCVREEELRDIFHSPLRRPLIVLQSCLPLCAINSIIYTSPSQPADSPWTIVFMSGVSALGIACHASSLPPPTEGIGMAKPRWDVLAFGHRPLQEGRGRRDGGGGLHSRREAKSRSVCPARAPGLGMRG